MFRVLWFKNKQAYHRFIAPDGCHYSFIIIKVHCFLKQGKTIEKLIKVNIFYSLDISATCHKTTLSWNQDGPNTRKLGAKMVPRSPKMEPRWSKHPPLQVGAKIEILASAKLLRAPPWTILTKMSQIMASGKAPGSILEASRLDFEGSGHQFEGSRPHL